MKIFINLSIVSFGLFAIVLFPGCMKLSNSLNKDVSLLPLLSSTAASTGRFLVFTNTNVLFESTSAGSWTRVTFTGPASLSRVAALSSGALLGITGTDALVWKSTDNGRTWSSTATGIPANAVRLTACGNGAVIGQSSSASGYKTYFSTNGGQNWTVSTTVFDVATTTLQDLGCTSGRFYAAMQTSPRFWRSSDGGNNWTGATTVPGFNADRIAALEGASDTIAYFYYATPESSLRSVDSGANFGAGAGFSALLGPTINFGGALSAINSQFFAGFIDSVSGQCKFVRSSDGATYTAGTAVACGTGFSLNAVAGSSTRMVYGGGNGTSSPLLLSATPDKPDLWSVENISSVSTGTNNIRAIVFLPN